MINIDDLLNKKNNPEQQEQTADIPKDQKLSAEEFVSEIVAPIQELQEDAVKNVKKIVRGSSEYTPVDGVITLPSEGVSVTILTTASTESIISTDGKVVLPIAIISVEGGSDTAEVTDVEVQVFANGDYETRGSFSLASTPYQNPVYTDVDITEYLLTGDQMVRLQAKGRETNVTGRLVFQSIVLTNLALEFATDYNQPVTGGVLAPSYYIYGSGVVKYLHLKVSGFLAGQPAFRDLEYTIGSGTYTISPYTGISIDDSGVNDVSVITHGVHTIEAWLSCSDKSGNILESPHITNSLMVVTDTANPQPYLMLQNVVDKAVNYEQMHLFDYAVYNPNGENVDMAISVTDYTGNTEYLRLENNATPNTKYNVTSTIEVEGMTDTTFFSYLRIFRYKDGMTYNFLSESTGQNLITIEMDNTDNFAPTAGADFYLNPKVRNNTEANPGVIINNATGEHIGGTWENFGFVNDGWVTAEDGVKVLRVTAGQRITIPYEPWNDFINTPASSMTLEFDIRVRNVTDEASPIIKCASTVAATGNPLGLIMRPMDGFLMTLSDVTEVDQNFGWQEGERTHISINVLHALKSSPTSANTISIVRVFVNNNINREFLFDSQTRGEFISAAGHGGIVIGQDEADIDIYSIRCYRKALSADDIRNNYVSSLPTSAEKVEYRNKNNILQDGLVNYSLAKEKYNTLVWHGEETSHTSQSNQKGWLEINMLKADGTPDRDHSGTICKATAGLPEKGQGSTAKTYYYWNQQYDIKKAETYVVVNGNVVTPATEETPGAVKDGWVDGNGKFKGSYYILDDSAPKMEKAVLKINYASSMQSHKQGATEMYNLLHTAVVGKNSMQKEDSKARVAVLERPFLYFVQGANDAEPVFKGLGTFGSGKMDKKTWGYDSDKFPDFCMLEGADNNQPLTDMVVPWEDSKVTYDPGEESFMYNGKANMDFDAGKTNKVQEGGTEVEYPKTDTYLSYFKSAWNFLFMHNPRIMPYISATGTGNYTTFVNDETTDKNIQYWMTATDNLANIYDVFRYDVVDKKWVNAGMPSNVSADGYAVKNLRTIYPNALSGTSAGDWSGINAAFIKAIVSDTKEHIGEYFNVNSLKFHYAFVVHLIAGTDNCSKNTYYVLDPVTHLIEMHADDLDTIFKTDNSGYQTKPYYIDRMHPYTEGGVLVFTEGTNNVLCNLLELMYEDTKELASTLKATLEAMGDLVTASDQASGIEKSAWGAFQKYFFSIQEYFPAVAYNETARLRYEYPASLNFVSDRNVKPISQSLGDQLQSEKQYVRRRLVYMSSYAAYGEFDLNGDAGFGFQTHARVSGQSPIVILDVTPHQYLYPTARVGQSLVDPHVRVKPNETYHFVIDDSGNLGDTVCGLKGANYYRSFGNIGDLSVSSDLDFQVTGSRLVEVIANPTVDAEFRPSTLRIVAPLVKRIDIKGSAVGGQLNITSLTRLRSINTEDTNITRVLFPSSELLSDVKLGGKITSLSIDNVPSLEVLTLQGYQFLTELSIGNNVGSFDSYAAVVGCYNAHAPLSVVSLRNVTWLNLSVDVLMWLSAIGDITLTGNISVYEPSQVAPSIDFEKKGVINLKWGNVDDETSSEHRGLKIVYAQREVMSAEMYGNFYNDGSEYYQFSLVPNSNFVNAYTKVVWSCTQPLYGGSVEIDANTGRLKVNRISPLPDNITITATITKYYGGQYDILVVSKNIEIYDRPAKLGDYVFADGTFSDTLDKQKTPIGICFYVAPRNADGEIVPELFNPEDRHQRLMVSLQNISAQSTDGVSFTSWQWGNYPDTEAANSLYYKNSGGADTQFTGVNQGLASGYFYDIQSIVNITSGGIAADPTSQSPTSASYIGDRNLRDEQSTMGILNGGWLPISCSYAMGDGFAYGETATQVSARRLTQQMANLLGGDYKEGDLVNSGMAKTLKIILQRNAILNSGLQEVGLGSLDIPNKGAGFTELDSLANLIVNIRNWAKDNVDSTNYNKWSQIYYPAASACYAYQPTILKSGEQLADKFKSHNWFLPTNGHLARLYWYYRQGAASNANIFKKAISEGVFSNFSASYTWSCTEDYSAGSWYVGFTVGTSYSNYKFNSYVVRAVSAF